MKDLDLKLETIKLLEEENGKTFHTKALKELSDKNFNGRVHLGTQLAEVSCDLSPDLHHLAHSSSCILEKVRRSIPTMNIQVNLGHSKQDDQHAVPKPTALTASPRRPA